MPNNIPSIVYHGTDSDTFSKFDKAFGNKWGSKFGFWFTNDYSQAHAFGKNILDCKLTIKTPKHITKEVFDTFRDAHHDDIQWWVNYRNSLISKGFDSLIVDGKVEQFGRFKIDPIHFYAVFDDTNIEIINTPLNESESPLSSIEMLELDKYDYSGFIYHGSNNQFERFKLEKTGHNQYGTGVYFTNNIKTAIGYGKYIKIIPVTKLKNMKEYNVVTEKGSKTPVTIIDFLIKQAPNKDWYTNYDENYIKAVIQFKKNLTGVFFEDIQTIWYELYKNNEDLLVSLLSNKLKINGMKINTGENLFIDDYEIFYTIFNLDMVDTAAYTLEELKKILPKK